MEQTIAAVATAPGEGGIGIVRISGPEAYEILCRVFPVSYTHLKYIVSPNYDMILTGRIR